jgi:hypothetical protein
VGLAVRRPIALYRSWFVSYRIVLCFGHTLSSDHVVLSRIVSRLHSRRSCSDRILIFPGLYHDFSQAVLYETYGTIYRRHDTFLGAWSVPIRIAMLWSDTYLWNWLHTASSIFFLFFERGIFGFFWLALNLKQHPTDILHAMVLLPCPLLSNSPYLLILLDKRLIEWSALWFFTPTDILLYIPIILNH